MPKVYVPINKITSARGLEHGDTLLDLEEGMKGRGMERPPLLTPEFEIVDGLRRIEVLRSWNHQGQILCVVTDSWEEILRYLTEETEVHGPYALDRAAQIYLATRVYGRKETYAARGKATRGVPKSKRQGLTTGARKMINNFAEATGHKGQQWLIENMIDFQRIGAFNLTRQQREEWNLLNDRITAGVLTPGGARNRMRRQWGLGAKAIGSGTPLGGAKEEPGDKRSQRKVTIQPYWVMQALGAAEGAVLGLNDSDLDDVLAKFEPEEIKNIIKRIEGFRRQTSQLLKTFKRKAAENDQHQQQDV